MALKPHTRPPANQLRILLVKPHSRLGTVLGLQRYMLLEPLELGYLAASVPGHLVRVLDLRLSRSPGRTFLQTLKDFRPDLVGFTGYSHESGTVKKLALEVRQRLPDTRIIVGGHHATTAALDYDVEPIDAIVRGEGCAPFRALVDAVASGGIVEGIENVLLPGERFDHEALDRWPHFPDPSRLPHPRRDLWNPGQYYSVWPAEKMPTFSTVYPPVAMVRTSWGCHMKCSFCIVPFLCGGVHMPRPVESVADEIERIPTGHIYFSDDENFIDEKFAWELAETLARRGVEKRYFAWTRSTTVNRSPALMQRWREIGLDGAFIGFEYITDEELRESSKASTVAANEKALETLRAMEVVVHAAFMVRPEYGSEKFEELRRYVQAMPPSQCSFSVCTPSPGTPDYQELEHRIWVDNPHDLHDCMHPLTKTTLPLREFSQRFATQIAEGVRKTPLRVNHHLAPPRDMIRIWRADRSYHSGFQKMYRDFPSELWD